jgi:hypothetical protein
MDWEVNESGENTYGEMSNFIETMKRRTKDLVLRNIKLFQSLPTIEEAKIIEKPLLRSSSSVGANYRATCRAHFLLNFPLQLKGQMKPFSGQKYWENLALWRRKGLWGSNLKPYKSLKSY